MLILLSKQLLLKRNEFAKKLWEIVCNKINYFYCLNICRRPSAYCAGTTFKYIKIVQTILLIVLYIRNSQP